MKLEHWLLSTIVTLAYKCADAIHPNVVILFGFGILALSILAPGRQRQRAVAGRSPALLLPAIVGGVVCVGCSFIFGRDGSELLSERGETIDGYYDDSDRRHGLHPARTIPPRGLEYVRGRWLKADGDGSVPSAVRFRGVNLPAKTPSAPSDLRDTKSRRRFHASKRDASFVGRPFPLDEAPAHFRRMSHDWGFNLVRLSTSWEAVMHEGPGVVDRPYLAYLRGLVTSAGEHGLYVLIDPHQDVWSRFAGGDGAPHWTLEAAGFDLEGAALHDAGSAVLHQFWNASEFGEMPRMMWTNNYWKLATATMFTLFFAGDVYAPGIAVEAAPTQGRDGESGRNETIQTFLRRNYLQFIDAVAETLKDCPNVIGFGTMNEPSNGFVGVGDVREIHAPVLHGHALSAFDSMRLGSGEPLEVPYYSTHFRSDATHLLNPRGKSAYKSPELDVWRRVGVHGIDKATNRTALLRPHHFALRPGEDFAGAYLRPFYDSVQSTVSRRNPNFVTYAEPFFDPTDPYPPAPADLAEQSFGWAPHWYDAVTLFLGRYSHWFSFDFEWNVPSVGPWMIDWTFRKNLRRIKHGEGRRGQSDRMHVVVGETGAPFAGSKEDYTRCLDRTLRAMEANDVDYAIWCYEAENNNIDGDLWNGEDLSLLSGGRGRGLQAAVRPWPYQYSSGLRVVSQSFDPVGVSYRLALEHEDGNDCADCAVMTVHVFVPSCHFLDPTFAASEGTLSYDRSRQNLKWEMHISASSLHILVIAESRKK